MVVFQRRDTRRNVSRSDEMRMSFMHRLAELTFCSRDQGATEGKRSRSAAKCRRTTYVGVERSQQTSSHGRGWRNLVVGNKSRRRIWAAESVDSLVRFGRYLRLRKSFFDFPGRALTFNQFPFINLIGKWKRSSTITSLHATVPTLHCIRQANSK